MTEPYIGEIRMVGFNFAPRGWALCDGQLLQVSSYDALFSLLGTTWGGDGRQTFGLPDLRGRVGIHQGSGAGLSPRPLGQKPGVETVTLAGNQVPVHNHQINAAQGAGDSELPAGRMWATSETQEVLYRQQTPPDQEMNASVVRPNVGGQHHDNMMPYLCVNFVIALVGVYPSRF